MNRTEAEIQVGDAVDVRYRGWHFPRRATVSALPRQHSNILTVRWANGDESLVHIDQVSLRTSVKS